MIWQSMETYKINNILECMKSNYNLDSNHIYVIGTSLGYYETLHFVSTSYNKITAIMTIHQGTTLTSYDDVKNIHPWILHGYKDTDMPFKHTQSVVDNLKSQDKDRCLRY